MIPLVFVSWEGLEGGEGVAWSLSLVLHWDLEFSSYDRDGCYPIDQSSTDIQLLPSSPF